MAAVSIAGFSSGSDRPETIAVDIVKWYETSTTIEELRQTDSLSAAEKMIAEVRGAEAELRRVIDAIPALAWCNSAHGSNEFLNRRWHDYTGLTPEESRGSGWRAVHHEGC